MSAPGAISGLKLKLFPTARIVSADSFTHVAAEMVTPDIAIIPYLDMSDGTYKLGGGFAITHVASGRAFASGQACLECARHVAGRLAGTTVDWPSVDFRDVAAFKASLGDQFDAVVSALRLLGDCGQQMCFHDERVCRACGMERQHASYCIHVVGPMVAAFNGPAGG